MSVTLKSGAVVNPRGGARPGAGRPFNEFKRKMASLAGGKDAYEFVRACIKGGKVDRHIVSTFGTVISVPASAQVRLAAFCEARDSGFGKPVQAFGGIDADGNLSPCVVMLSPQQLGIPGGLQ